MARDAEAERPTRFRWMEIPAVFAVPLRRGFLPACDGSAFRRCAPAPSTEPETCLVEGVVRVVIPARLHGDAGLGRIGGARVLFGGGCGMDYPTEDEVRTMTNREFASLMRSQADSIDQSLRRDALPLADDSGPPSRL
jgi:hypothetical protein